MGCYKYLGVSLKDMLLWSPSKEVVCRKDLNRLNFLRRVRSFTACICMLTMFYQSVVEGARLGLSHQSERW